MLLTVRIIQVPIMVNVDISVALWPGVRDGVVGTDAGIDPEKSPTTRHSSASTVWKGDVSPCFIFDPTAVAVLVVLCK
jgi:hypothetical protein